MAKTGKITIIVSTITVALLLLYIAATRVSPPTLTVPPEHSLPNSQPADSAMINDNDTIFLHEIGITPDTLDIEDFNAGNIMQKKPLILDDTQYRKLLDGCVFNSGTQLESAIIGVIPLAGNNMMCVYRITFGDDGIIYFVTYDNNGKITDSLYTGQWDDSGTLDLENFEYPATTTHYTDIVNARFSTTDTLIISRHFQVVESSGDTDSCTYSCMTNYRYTIAPDASMTLVDISEQITGHMPPNEFIEPELRDQINQWQKSAEQLLRTPLSQTDFGQWDQLACSHSEYYWIRSCIIALLYRNPAQCLEWLTRHPDSTGISAAITTAAADNEIDTEIQKLIQATLPDD